MNFIVRNLALGLLLLAAPVASYAEQQNGDTQADKATAKSVWSFAGITRQMSGNPEKGTDRVIYFKKNENGQIVLSGIGAVASDAAIDKPETAIAVARLRYSFLKKMREPLAIDADFVTENEMSLFVMDVRKNRMWEIGRKNAETLFRTVKSSGKHGDWQEFSKG